MDLRVHLAKSATYDAIKKTFNEAAEGKMKAILKYTKNNAVSSDLIGYSPSSMFDANAVQYLKKSKNYFDKQWVVNDKFNKWVFIIIFIIVFIIVDY